MGPARWGLCNELGGDAPCSLPLGHKGAHQPQLPWYHATPVTGATQTIRYRGNARTSAARADDEARLAAVRSWYPTSRTYVPGRWKGSDWVVAFLLLIALIGIIVLFYMVATTPDGETVVIYEYRPPVVAAAAAPVVEGPAMKVCPRCAEDIRAAAIVCRYCGHEFGNVLIG